MVQEHVKYPQDKKQHGTLKPNIKKIIVKNFLTVTGALLLIILVIFIINWQVGLDVFLIPFEVLDITIDTSVILLYMILTTVAVYLFLFIINSLITRKIRYEFYSDKLILYKNYLFSVKPKEIPYKNIVKISYNSDDIFNKIFNTGTVVLDVSGMKENKINLEFVDNIEQTVKYIQDALQRFKSVKQAQFAKNYEITTILDKY